MNKVSKNTDSQILSRVYGHGRGWVFTPNHFKDLGSRDAIASALKRYKQSGLIRPLARGLQQSMSPAPSPKPATRSWSKLMSGEIRVKEAAEIVGEIIRWP